MRLSVLVIAVVLASALVAGVVFILVNRAPASPAAAVEVVAAKLEVPWTIAFAPDGRLLFTERVGRVKVITGNETATLLQLSVAASGEGGLLGLALDPDFAANHHVYVYYTYRDGQNQLWNRVSRLEEKNSSLLNETVIVDGIPGATIHDGGRIKFGPDGKLYIGTGDAARSQLAQDLNSLAGKILRVNPDGSAPSDNPYPNSPIYSYGHRNVQGLAWHPSTKTLFATEHGSSAHDEINLIEPGKNYGWPTIIGKGNNPNYTDPVYETGTVTWAPSGACTYDGSRFAQLRGKLLVATLRGQHMSIVSFDPPSYRTVSSTVNLYQDVFGRLLREVVQGPDGYLYLTTSNRDGRGAPAEQDDRILRISSLPQESTSRLAPVIVASYRALMLSEEITVKTSMDNWRLKPKIKT